MHGIESVTTAILSTALDAASLRQQVIAANIANASRADYVAQRASFEATFNDLASGSSAWSTRHSLVDNVDLRMHVEPDLAPDGTRHAVQLDVEVAALTQNTVHYEALIKGLSKYMSVLASAVSDGKR